MNRIIYYSIFAVLLVTQHDTVAQSVAQDTSLQTHLAIVARANQDSIVVRWAPMITAAWFAGNQSGYVLERASIANGKTGAFQRVSSGAIRPWTAAHWTEELVKRGEPDEHNPAVLYEGLAKGLLYDSASVSIKSQGFENLADLAKQKNNLDMTLTLALMAADRSASAAEGLGLRFVDHNVKAGESYTYRVYLVKQPKVYRVDTGSVTVKNEKYIANTKSVIVPLEGDLRITLSWPANRNLGTYVVDRSDDGGRTFNRLTKIPLMTLRHGPIAVGDSEVYLDSTIQNYTPYIYRVFGTSFFADEELVGEVNAMGRDITPPGSPIIFNPKEVPIHRAELTWQMNEPVCGDLLGFRVLRGIADSGLFTPVLAALLPPSARTYFDSTYADTIANYYVIEAVDTARNVSRSFSAYLVLADTTPPSIPRWVRGTMDTNGVVTLKIMANHERDLMGYHIFRANAPEHEFSSIIESYVDPESPHSRDTIFYDTVTTKTLTSFVYYRVTALDVSYNESPFSWILAVPRPDLIAPVKPVIKSTHVTDSSVTLDFVPSSSTDVQRHVLYRRLQNAKRWDSTAVLSGKANHAVDTAVKQGVVYEYALEAVDTTGNRSGLSGAVTARPYPNSSIEGIHDLRAVYDPNARQVVLNWTPPFISNIHFVIYRGIGAQGVERFTDVKESHYTDNAIATGVYHYALKVLGSDGKQSKLSERVEVEIRQ